ncbi:SRPBCC family protein [Streptosporangium carneum]|uniref:Activator of HSP90 ATPase n=1 Tax=Streptosporangium carneum TaxID=47481 RepID=A0A9W6MBQ6_9ACTN|nr:SRPBCC domain-containing protein [Streptosporangium carneum]GLK08292.1 activator of HSP90 ATPase [Streptosporangium carneum]
MTETSSTQGADAGDASRGFTITRILDAPRELVFKAWTEPEHFTHWFGLPGSTLPVATISMDVRPGGTWSALMFDGPERTELPFAGKYLEVVEPERLVLTLAHPGDPTNPNVEVMTVVLTDLGDKTEMVFQQSGHLSEEEYAQVKEGNTIFFGRLADYLAQV